MKFVNVPDTFLEIYFHDLIPVNIQKRWTVGYNISTQIKHVVNVL